MMKRKTLEAATNAEINSLVSTNALADLLARPAIEEIVDTPAEQNNEALSRAHFDWLNGRVPKGVH
jgi:hypothetical protein